MLLPPSGRLGMFLRGCNNRSYRRNMQRQRQSSLPALSFFIWAGKLVTKSFFQGQLCCQLQPLHTLTTEWQCCHANETRSKELLSLPGHTQPSPSHLLLRVSSREGKFRCQLSGGVFKRRVGKGQPGCQQSQAQAAPQASPSAPHTSALPTQQPVPFILDTLSPSLFHITISWFS